MQLEIPTLGFIAWSGTGKTTLICELLPLLRARGIRVGVIKHTHHNVEFDTPGKDSYRLRRSGADQMLVTSANRWALFGDRRNREPNLDIACELARMNTDELDLVLVESFRSAPIPKIELHRTEMGKPLIYPDDRSVIAVASNNELGIASPLTQLNLNDPPAIASYIELQIVEFGRNATDKPSATKNQ